MNHKLDTNNKCNCGSNRLLQLSGKTNDTCCMRQGEFEYDGYVPYGIGVGGGDYINFTYCLDCGKIQPKAGAWSAKDLKDAVAR